MTPSRILYLSLCLLGCTKIADHPTYHYPVNMIPIAVRKVHVDINFTPHEFHLLAETAERLNEETRGRFQVLLLQDWDSNFPLYLPKDHWRILRVLEGSQRSKDFDDLKGEHVWGLCEHLTNTIYMIPDRTVTRENAFLHVSEHELLHSIGLDHTTDKTGIMYRYIQEKLPLTFQESDRAAFCEAVGCNTKDIWGK